MYFILLPIIKFCTTTRNKKKTNTQERGGNFLDGQKRTGSKNGEGGLTVNGELQFLPHPPWAGAVQRYFQVDGNELDDDP